MTIAESEFVAAAMQAFRDDRADVALDTLGWWDLLAHLDDVEARTAAFAVFRAQGIELADSPALGGLVAQPYLDGTDVTPGAVVAAVRRQSTRRGTVDVVVGDPGDRAVLIDRPGLGAFIVDRDAVDRLDGTPAIAEADASRARQRAEFLGRVALSCEIAGAAGEAVRVAVDHATTREQFGEPIGRFQAVRHLLAWAQTDCVAVDALARRTIELDRAAPSHTDEILKALAGRNGRAACERALQVLGGIGFTQEHPHHRHHARVLALDALLGSSSGLTAALGAWYRGTTTEPSLALSSLLHASES